MPKRFLAYSLPILAALMISGCGGSGSNTTTNTTYPTNAPGRVAAEEAAQAYIGSYQTFNLLIGSNGSKTLSKRTGLLFMKPQANTYTYLGYGYYIEVVATQTGHIAYMSTNGTTNNAGNVSITQGANGSYTAVFDITSGNLISTGKAIVSNVSVTSSGVDGQVSIALVVNGVTINMTGTFTNTVLSVSTLSTQINSTTVTFTNFTPQGNTETTNFTAGALPGTLTANPDGSGSDTDSDTYGTWTLTWTAAGVGTLTEPNGTTVSIGSITALTF